MKILIYHCEALFFLIFLTSLSFCYGGQKNIDRDSLEVAKIASEIKKAIMEQNNKIILKYVSAKGLSYVDSHISILELEKESLDESSWLNQYLYYGKSSIRSYFNKTIRIEIKINKSENKHWIILFCSTDFPTPLECSLIKEKGKWVFTDFISFL
jgi:hypothetical protein